MNLKIPDFSGLRKSERDFLGLYVIGERQKWRDHIRNKVDEIQIAVESIGSTTESKEKAIASLRSVRASIAVRLNPDDNADKDLLTHLDELIDKCKTNAGEEVQKAANVVIEKISWMLKHDWNRAKHETRPIWFFWKSDDKVDRLNKTITKPSTICDIGNMVVFVLTISAVILIGYLGLKALLTCLMLNVQFV